MLSAETRLIFSHLLLPTIPTYLSFNSSSRRKNGNGKSGSICYKFKILVAYWMCVCISWVAIHSWRISMEGSSESGWQRSDNSSRELNFFPDLERNPRFNLGSTLRPSGDTSSDFEFRPGRKGRNRLSLPQSNQFQPYTEDGLSMDPVVRGLECGDVSLRQWLDNPERTVDALECLHIFTQIVGIVNLAHDQGIVVHNVRPSCFVMSSFNRVSFIESASCSDSGSDSCEEGTNSHTGDFKGLSSPMHQDSQQVTVSLQLDMNSTRPSKEVTDPSSMHLSSANAMVESEASNANRKEEKNISFPMKQILIMETNWYTSPEEVSGASGSCFSDIYRLGVLLFELFCTFSSADEKSSTMSSLRHRVLPPQLLLKWPKEAAFCLWLLHPEPTSRPKLPELLQSDFLNEPRESLVDREAEIELRESIEEQELLLEFLLLVKQKKQEAANQFNEMVNFLASDIDEVSKLHGALRTKVAPSLNSGNDSGLSPPSASTADEGDLCSSGSRKRGRPGLNSFQSGEFDNHLEDNHKSVGPDKNHGSALSKSARLMKNFKRLESAYFLSRRRALKPSGKSLLVRSSQVSSGARGSVALTERSSVSNFSSKEKCNEDRQSGWVSSFLGGLCQYLSFSKLDVKADLKQGDLLHSSNLVCSLGFDRDGEFFATAGVNKKIKVFEYNSILEKDSDIHYPVVEMASRSKLSSICWNGYIKSQIASSNFEGVVQVWDVTRSQMFMEMREHEKRVWSVDYSVADPTLLASGSDDGSVKLWNINQGASVLNIKTKANVCCVQFPLESNRCLAFGSADHKIYYYDLRNCKMPLCTLVGHNKTVSYVKFIDSTTVVSASTDNTLKLWDLSMSSSRVLDSPLQSFTGHLNVKNFVGLSVSDGYIATGSETNEVFVYHKALPMPALSYKFDSTDPLSGDEVIDSSQFISSVCWRGQSTTLVAANSMGDIKLLEMV